MNIKTEPVYMCVHVCTQLVASWGNKCPYKGKGLEDFLHLTYEGGAAPPVVGVVSLGGTEAGEGTIFLTPIFGKLYPEG